MGELLHFHVVEGLLEHEQTVRLADLGAHLLPRIIRVSGANDDLEGWIHFPDARNGFHAVPAGGHSHVHKSQGVRPLFCERLLDFFQALFSLVGGVQLKSDLLGNRLVLIEQGCFYFAGRRAPLLGRTEDVAKVGVDARIIVNHQNAMVRLRFGAFHG